MSITYNAGYTYTNGELQTVAKANQAQTARSISCDTNNVLGRSTAGTGQIEEIPCTAAGRALLAGANAAAQRTTLDVPATAAVLAVANNLSDLADPAAARVNLGILDSAVRCATQLDTVSDSVFADVDGLTVNLTTGRTYTIEGHVAYSAPTGGGCVIRLTGTATASAVVGVSKLFAAGTVQISATGTSLPIDLSLSVNSGLFDFAVTIVCNGSGTLKVQAKQFGSDGVAVTSVLKSSYLKLLA